MSFAVRLVDQTVGMHPPIVRQLRLASERMTLRELLARRIEEEVAAFNAGNDAPQPLVVPTEREQRLNGRPPKAPRVVDGARQFAAAVEAFERNRIMVIVNNRQVEDLDQPLVVTTDTEVRFLKLVPLVGG
jgi:hypothetical protein